MAFQQVRAHLSSQGFFPKSEELESYLSIRDEIDRELRVVEDALSYALGEDQEQEFEEYYQSLCHRRTLISDNIRKERLLLFKIKNYIVSNFTSYSSLYAQMMEKAHFRMRSRYISRVIEHLTDVYNIYLLQENDRLRRRLEWRSFYEVNKHNFNLLSCDPDVEAIEEVVEDAAIAEEYRIQATLCRMVQKGNRFYKSDAAQSWYRAGSTGPLKVEEEIPSRRLDLLDKIKARVFIHSLYRTGSNIVYSIFNASRRVVHNVGVVYNRYWAWAKDYDKGIVDYDYYPEIRYKCDVDERTERYIKELEDQIYIAQPEMDDPVVEGAHGSETATESQASNVILTEQNGESVEVAAAVEPSWGDWCSSEVKPSYTSITDRWLQIDTFEWNKDSVAGEIIKKYDLPYYVLGREPSLCRIPNILPFTIHRYWRGDIEIKIQVNSNKFQVGSLQCAWLYSPDFDANISQRENMYCLSQAHHVLINANTSNEATLVIPYKYHLPYLHTKPREDMPDALKLGRLYITVLNPLTVPTSGATSCNISIFVKFSNNEFTGMLSSNIDPLPLISSPEMMEGFAIAEQVLHQINANDNRDNPPIVSAPRFLVPTASHSWSVGTGLAEPVHPLRLDAKGQTPYPPGVPKMDETNIKQLVTTFGLVGQLEWNKDHAKGEMLWAVDASPIFHKGQYFNKAGSSTSSLRNYILPPVAVVSSMFMAWRGTLEFRFDFVASQFHTGRLMLAYIPGASESTVVDLAAMRASTNVVLSVQNTNSYTFKIPFICNKPAWERRFGGEYRPEDGFAPSRVYICILNKLIPMQSVSDKVFINVYVRAGDDFELMIPVQPSLGLTNNDKFSVKNATSQIVALDGYSPYYSGSFENLTLCQCFRWGTLAHQIAQFSHDNVKLGSQIQISNIATKDPKFYVIDDQQQKRMIEWAVFTYPSELGYNVGIPFLDKESAMKFAKLDQIDGKGINEACKLMQSGFIPKTWSASPEYTSAKWNIVNSAPPAEVADFEVLYPPGKLAHPEGERSNAVNVLDVGTVRKTQAGMSLYGERFISLKDLGRRYQFYGVKIINTINKTDSDKIKFSFPALPQGLTLNLGSSTNVNEISNRARDGHIPLICSGFRWYRGGLRFRIVFDSDPDIGVYVQHRPDKQVMSLEISNPNKHIQLEDIACHTYASYLQLTSVNGILEFEVPFYLLGMYGLLQTPKLTKTDESNYFSLGDIVVGVVLANIDRQPKNVMATVYYSLADDFGCSTFQGFPPVVFVNDVPPLPSNVAEPEMGLFGYFADKKQETLKEVSDAISDGITHAVEDQKKNLEEKLSDTVNAITNSLSALNVNYRDTLFKISLQILHVVANFTPATIALSIINILLDLKLLLSVSITSLCDAIKGAVLTLIRGSSSEQLSEEVELTPETIKAEPEINLALDGPMWIKVVSALYVAIATTFSVKTAPRGVSRLVHILTKGLGDSLRNGAFMLSFVGNIFETVKAILYSLLSYVYPIESSYLTLEEDIPDIKAWVDEVYYLDGKNLEIQISKDDKWLDRIQSAMVFGRRLIVKLIDSEDKRLAQISRVYEKVKKLYDKAEAMGQHPYVRREPFCVWVYGEPGIGKSFLMEHFTSKLLAAIDYKLKGPKTYTIMPTSDFWTGCKNQPVLNLDDAFSVEMGETVERQLNYMYMVKSPVALNPPMADLSDKHIRYTPEIFYINSNKAFLNIAGLDPTAIHRRRDLLIHARLKHPYTNVSQVPREILEKFGHLEFYVHANPLTKVVKYLPTYISYETLVNDACTKYKCFYHTEYQNFSDRLDTYDAILDVADDGDDIEHCRPIREQMLELVGAQQRQYEKDFEKCLYLKGKNVYTKHVIPFMVDFKDRYKSCKSLGKFLYKMYAKPEMVTEESDDDDVETIIDAAPSQVEIEDVTDYASLNDNMWVPLTANDKFEYAAFVNNRLTGERGRLKYDPDKLCSDDMPYVRENYVAHCMNTYEENVIPLSWTVEGLYTRQTPVIEKKLYVICPLTGHYLFNLPEGIFSFRKVKSGMLIPNENQNCSPQLIKDVNDLIHKIEDHEGRHISTKTTRANDFVHKLYHILLDQNFILSSVDVNFFKSIQELPDTHLFSISNITEDELIIQFCKVLPNLSKIHFKNRPWLILDYLYFWNCASSFSFCSHANPQHKFEWDSTTQEYIINNKERVDNLVVCKDACLLKIPIFHRLFQYRTLMCSFKNRRLYTKKNYAFLPKYFKEEDCHEDQLDLDNWLGDVKKNVADFYVRKGKNILVSVAFTCISVFASFVTIMSGSYLLGKLLDFGLSFMTKQKIAPSPSVSMDSYLNYMSVAENSYKLEQRPQVNPVARLSTTLGEASDQNFNNIIRKILNNSFIIIAEYIDQNNVKISHVGRGLGINNNRGLMIRHYHDLFLTLPSHTKFYIQREGQGVKGNPTQIPYLELVTHAFVVHDEKYSSNFFVIEFPPQVPAFRDIRNNIATAADHSNVGSVGDLVSFGSGIKNDLHVSVHSDVYIMGTKTMDPVNMYRCYGYHYHGKGLCGSILVAKNLPNSPIIGMHVAGCNGLGFSEPLFRDIFVKLPAQVIDHYEDPELDEISPSTKLLETTVTYAGAENAEPHRETGKTQLVPSYIHGVFPVKTEPNPLKPSDPRLPPNSSPMLLGCEKHGKPVGVFNSKDLDIATEDLTNVILSTVLPVRTEVGVLSLQDAICGNSTIPHFESLEWNTSPGYGYGAERKGRKGKKFLFNLVEKQDGYKLNGLNPKLKEIMIKKKQMRQKGIVPFTVFTDCLKDTTLPVEKCKIPGKTRIFSISPVDFTIQFKQYFGDFLASYTKARFNAEHAIGINVHGEEWSELATRLSLKGKKIVSGDYSNFGPGLSLQVARKAFDVILSWYRHHKSTEADMLIRECMVREILNAPHLCFNFIYRVFAGIPSGSPITTPLNSLVNSLYIRLAWCELMRDSDYCFLQDFHNHVNIITYGDDIIMNVSDIVIEKFNILTLSSFFSNYRIMFTDSRKVEAVEPFTSLLETSFLSCNFVPHPYRRGQWCSALKQISVEGCVNWCHRKGDLIENTIQNCDMALLLAYGWGEEYYNAVKLTCLNALSQKQIKWYPKSWKEQDVRIWDKGLDVNSFYTNSIFNFF